MRRWLLVVAAVVVTVAVWFVVADDPLDWFQGDFDSTLADHAARVVQQVDEGIAASPSTRILDDDGPLTEVSLLADGHRVRTSATAGIDDLSVRLYDERGSRTGCQAPPDTVRSSWSGGGADERIDSTSGTGGDADVALEVEARLMDGSLMRRGVAAPIDASGADADGSWLDLAWLEDVGVHVDWRREEGDVRFRVRPAVAGGSFELRVGEEVRPLQQATDGSWLGGAPAAAVRQVVVRVLEDDGLRIEID